MKFINKETKNVIEVKDTYMINKYKKYPSKFEVVEEKEKPKKEK